MEQEKAVDSSVSPLGSSFWGYCQPQPQHQPLVGWEEAVLPSPTPTTWTGLLGPQRCPRPPGGACGGAPSMSVYVCVLRGSWWRVNCPVCLVEHWLGRQGLGVELARHRQLVPREVSRWRERAMRPVGSRRPLSHSVDGTNSVHKNNPGLGPALQNFSSSFKPTSSLLSPMAWEEASSFLI